MADIMVAVQFMKDIAANDSHGYDQTNRYGPDYDCSSLIAAALNAAKFNINKKAYTGNLHQYLTAAGFVSCASPWKAGDIHLTPGKHVAMSVSPSKIVHAKYNENKGITGGKTGDQTGEEICEESYYVPSYGWKYHLRYPKEEQTFKTMKDLVTEVCNGTWGHGSDREKRLTAAGYYYPTVRALVNQRYTKQTVTKAMVQDYARRYLAGEYGTFAEASDIWAKNGVDPIQVLLAIYDTMGYSYGT